MSGQRPDIACVIFDIDGTLTRTNELIFASFNHLAQRYLGRTFTEREIIALFGPPEEGALNKVFHGRNIDTLMDELCDYYQQHHDAMASLHPGMEEVLGFLKEHGVHLAVFTGKGKRTAMITLEALDIAQYFELVVSGNDVVRHKPDPEGIRLVLEAFDVPPRRALMVGDSLGDIAAARGAGVPVAAVLWDAYDRERVMKAGADHVFHDVTGLYNWFRTQIN